MSKLRSVLSWIGWVIACVLAFLHFRRNPDVVIIPGKVDAPPGQDMSDTLPVEKLDDMRNRLKDGK
jgi:hypothetical protein